DEIEALCKAAHAKGLFVHVDGARFANAVASLKASPADLSWRAGVDALSFGGTKNGCLAAEAVIFFDKALAGDFALRRKRAPRR
ncbi:MAG: low specificity L-threonine aldolase, partial [Rhizobiales bacterium]|nr:low specificity L-threonine aldolase [Hyphomicrobiales bacterium]